MASAYLGLGWDRGGVAVGGVGGGGERSSKTPALDSTDSRLSHGVVLAPGRCRPQVSLSLGGELLVVALQLEQQRGGLQSGHGAPRDDGGEDKVPPAPESRGGEPGVAPCGCRPLLPQCVPKGQKGDCGPRGEEQGHDGAPELPLELGDAEAWDELDLLAAAGALGLGLGLRLEGGGGGGSAG